MCGTSVCRGHSSGPPITPLWETLWKAVSAPARGAVALGVSAKWSSVCGKNRAPCSRLCPCVSVFLTLVLVVIPPGPMTASCTGHCSTSTWNEVLKPRELTLMRWYLGIGRSNEQGMIVQDLSIRLNYNAPSSAEESYKSTIRKLRKQLGGGSVALHPARDTRCPTGGW